MARISRLDHNEASPEMAILYNETFAQRANVPNMFRVMAHGPEIFSTMQAHSALCLTLERSRPNSRKSAFLINTGATPLKSCGKRVPESLGAFAAGRPGIWIDAAA